jgi:hypothetical protein
MRPIDADLLISNLNKRIKTQRSTMEIIRDIIPMINEQPTVGEEIPCKIGDVIWYNDFGYPYSYSYRVTGFSYGNLYKDGEEYGEDNKVTIYYSNYNGSITGKFAASDIGKTIFLSAFNAEKALLEKEREG